jgi:4-hydroxyacetophenone monooxygenase
VRDLVDTTDAEIEQYLLDGDPMTLRSALFQLTGDPRLASSELADTYAFVGPTRVLADPDAIALIRSMAADYLRARRDGRAPDVGNGPSERLRKSLELAVGEPIPDAALDFCIEELAIERVPRRHELTHRPPDLERFHVVVIGAGVGGINAAISLQESGIPFTVLEKNDGVGGCWHDNRYPGCRVDVASRAYSHTFGLEYPWEHWYAPQSENNDYLQWCVDRFGVRDRIRCNTEVTAVTWDEATSTWSVVYKDADGEAGTMIANAVISAVGFLSRPKFPHIDGMETFRGPSFHTAWWDETLDPEGKHIAVVGTGCSGMQLVPELERLGSTVTVFQRHPSWVFEVPIYRSRLPEGVKWLDRNMPLFRNFEKFRAIWTTFDHVAAAPFFKDPEWDDADSLGATNQAVREMCMAYLHQKLAGRPDLLEVSVPRSPVLATRPVIDNGWFDAITGPNVELVSEPIARIVPDGIVTASGRTIEVDAIAYATGFETSKFLWPMEVRGRNGTVQDLWARDGARAYLGIALPGFPNFFCVYGPNTNSNQGTIPTMGSELQTRYAIQCIEELFRTGAAAIDLTREAYDSYNDRLDEGLAKTIFSDPRIDTYYVNEFGRSSSQTCWPTLVYWEMTRRPDFSDYILSGSLEVTDGREESAARPSAIPTSR